MQMNCCKTSNLFAILAMLGALGLVGFSIGQQQQTSDGNKALNPTSNTLDKDGSGSSKMETITLGAGCFWCVEAIFEEIKGVVSVTSGYSNGQVVNPTYEQVCTGTTGCVEVCQIVFDPDQVSLGKILHVFWRTHDPTSLNRQGADSGTQYRSGIYFHNQRQKEYAEKYKKKLDESGAFDKPIVTEIVPVMNFSRAENYHQDYFRTNPNAGYCRNVIVPKMSKFKQVFADVLKEPNK